MFDDGLEAAQGDRRVLADLAGDVEAEVRRSGCRKLLVAAAWADAHSEVEHPDGGMLVERLLPLGPDGCPLVAETCSAGLALAFHTSIQAAKGWISDALNVRHRLPRLWERVVAGEVYAWKSREIAHATAHLNVLTARIVDKLLHDQVELIAWTRFVKILDATLLQVDQRTYRERAAKAAAQRDVRATQSSDGLRTLVARGTSGDVAMFLALVDAIAEALADEGDEDPYPVRKSKAIGIAAYPDRAQDLLSRGRHREDATRDPWVQVDSHRADPTDPWADVLPPAGWETARHGNFHQPALDEEWVVPLTPEAEGEWPDDDAVDPGDLLLYCLGFCTALGGHHRSEDACLFPELLHRHPELTETIAYLEQDHSMISYLLGGLEQVIQTQAPPDEVARHLEGIAAIMESHFRYEERQLTSILADLDLEAPVQDVLGPL